MTLRCKPGDLCVIDLPDGCMPEVIRVQLHGVPVTTLHLVGTSAPIWMIAPAPSVFNPVAQTDARGVFWQSGQGIVHGMYDGWLRPLKGLPVPAATPTTTDLKAPLCALSKTS